MKLSGIPIPTLRRLPVYYQQLLIVLGEGKKFISSEDLGKACGSAPEQVRKDLSILAGQGRSRVGYDIKDLANSIEEYLGLMNDKMAVLVGVGNLGKALALYQGFNQYGLRIEYLFDIDSKKIGQKVGSLQILPIDQLPELVKNLKIRIGIITTPPEAAQTVADAMVASDIQAIWNFSTLHLNVPKEVLVRDVDLSLELAVISHYISNLENRVISD